MSRRYKGAVLSATPPTTSTSSASGVWTEQQFMQGVASGSWPALAGAPTIGTATAGAVSASVAFTAPTYVGSGITGYTATSSPGGITGTGASSPVTVSGLTAGTAYTFTVTATTAAGQGPASAASNSVTPTAPPYIEEVFSTYLYTGNGSTQTITNGIDLSTYGGLVWTKGRGNYYANTNHGWFDTARGVNKFIWSNSTASQGTESTLTNFGTTGFSLGADVNYAMCNGNTENYASWTFRKQPKFFDVVTYTGTSSAQNIAHNLGSTPACIIVKKLNDASIWPVYHASLGGADKYLTLNTTDASDSAPSLWNNTAPTSTQFTVGTSGSTNGSGNTFVAYLFASNAGGFGSTGSDNVISCGSYTGTASTDVTVNLGYEPQWVMIKRTNSSGSPAWWIGDTMRGLNMQGINRLEAWTDAAEGAAYNGINPTSTGFVLPTGTVLNDSASSTYIYIAIRRGPMKVPTSGTSVYEGTTRTGTGAAASISGLSFPPDAVLTRNRTSNGSSRYAFYDKLRGPTIYLDTAATDSEFTVAQSLTSFNQTGESFGTGAISNYSGDPYINWNFRRAPSFFDEVCWTGDLTTGRLINHNLGVVPELIIFKSRSSSSAWFVGANFTASTVDRLYLNLTNAATTGGYSNANFFGAQPTATQFNIGSNTYNEYTYVAYLFATAAGVSKVGSYTGTGSNITVNCGFTGGARFVMVKRTDSTGPWVVLDTARGMVAFSDYYLYLNSADPESDANILYTASTGFQVQAGAGGALNASGGTYIFLAIA
jgi:hypothetical protein